MRHRLNIITLCCLTAATLLFILSVQTVQSIRSAASIGVSDLDQPSALPAASSPKIHDQKFGHLAYAEASARTLALVRRAQSGEKLRQEASTAFEAMAARASQSGVELTLVSGFRSIATQTEVFQSKIRRSGSIEAAVKVVAPPGYSEHHTGYAADISDVNAPETTLSPRFETTQAFQWLQQNAAEFGFELSFPKNGAQGVSYEPWHWRYHRPPTAHKIFELAEQLYPNRS
jgi:zinc D-Ala-D-Ala carboxypeptidase